MLQSSSGWARRAVLVALVAALPAVAAFGLSPSAPVRAAEAPPALHSPVPAPGEVVSSGRVPVRVRTQTTRPIAAVDLWVDGRRVDGDAAIERVGEDTAVSLSADLLPGDRTLRLDVTDDSGATASRTWGVTATDVVIERHAGADRLQTAVSIAQATFPEEKGAPAAVLARADDFADALAGVPLAAAVDGPLLLSHRTSLPAAVAEELGRVLAPGSTVHLLGGEAAIGSEVARAVRALGHRTQRHAGSDRFGTAAAVAAALPSTTGAVLASGTTFPDALAASAPAARDGLPILLTARDVLPEATRAALAGRQRVTIAGGTAAVGADVERTVGALVRDVRRVAGADRYATAAALVEAFYDVPDGVSLASGLAFPDALAGTRHAVGRDQPLLLTAPAGLPRATADTLAALAPRRLDVYGGESAVDGSVAASARRVAVDGPARPRLVGAVPQPASVLGHLPTVDLRFDRPVDPARSTVYLSVDGREVAGTLRGSGATLELQVASSTPAWAPDVPWPGRVVLAASSSDGQLGHDEIAFTFLEPDPVYATAGPVPLILPTRGVDMIGFHQSGHPGAQAQVERPTATPKLTLPSRGRGTGLTTAADIVADPHMPILAPATGRVVRAGSYVLYCRYTDQYAVIAPDERPDWEVKILHFHGLRVAAGDRVVAGETVIGAGPRQLPFSSQVDDYSSTRWPHLHVEVVDPSVPPRPGGGC